MFVLMEALATLPATKSLPSRSRSVAGGDFFSPGPCNKWSMSYASGAF